MNMIDISSSYNVLCKIVIHNVSENSIWGTDKILFYFTLNNAISKQDLAPLKEIQPFCNWTSSWATPNPRNYKFPSSPWNDNEILHFVLSLNPSILYSIFNKWFSPSVSAIK